MGVACDAVSAILREPVNILHNLFSKGNDLVGWTRNVLSSKNAQYF